MKEFKKAQVIAKNMPTGSYAAGCPSNMNQNKTACIKCERVG